MGKSPVTGVYPNLRTPLIVSRYPHQALAACCSFSDIVLGQPTTCKVSIANLIRDAKKRAMTSLNVGVPSKRKERKHYDEHQDTLVGHERGTHSQFTSNPKVWSFNQRPLPFFQQCCGASTIDFPGRPCVASSILIL